MSTTGYLALLAKLTALDVPEDTKSVFRSIVEAQLKAEAPDREARIRLVRDQLAAGMPRAEICRQLCERFAIGKSQAYRDIDAALNLSQPMGNS